MPDPELDLVAFSARKATALAALEREAEFAAQARWLEQVNAQARFREGGRLRALPEGRASVVRPAVLLSSRQDSLG